MSKITIDKHKILSSSLKYKTQVDHVCLIFGKILPFIKVGDKSLINHWIGLHEVPAKLNFEGETSEVLLSSQAHFVMCLG